MSQKELKDTSNRWRSDYFFFSPFSGWQKRFYRWTERRVVSGKALSRLIIFQIDEHIFLSFKKELWLALEKGKVFCSCSSILGFCGGSESCQATRRHDSISFSIRRSCESAFLLIRQLNKFFIHRSNDPKFYKFNSLNGKWTGRNITM